MDELLFLCWLWFGLVYGMCLYLHLSLSCCFGLITECVSYFYCDDRFRKRPVELTINYCWILL